MSIQIHTASQESGRAEVRGRMKGLLASITEAGRTDPADVDALNASTERFKEEVKAFYFAFTGRQLTAAELMDVIGA